MLNEVEEAVRAGGDERQIHKKVKYPVTESGFGAGLWYLRSRVRTRLKPSDFSGEKSTACLRRGSKAVCLMSLGMLLLWR
jgi:hypothetical protein